VVNYVAKTTDVHDIKGWLGFSMFKDVEEEQTSQHAH